MPCINRKTSLTMNKRDAKFMQRAIYLAQKGMYSNAGGPFGCVIVKDDEIIAEGYNRVTSKCDPTAHAEVVAIRKACKKLKAFQLDDCIMYTSCEPCPMCMGAIYWARPTKVFYACNREDAAQIHFDDQFIYDELKVDIGKRQIEFEQISQSESRVVFQQWRNKEDKTQY